MRAFIAIELTEPIREALAKLAKRLHGPSPKVSWVRTENLHLTLCFLGDVHESQADAIGELLTLSLKTVRPFTLRVSGTGAFPDIHRPGVIWAGADAGEFPLESLESFACGAAVASGVQLERKPFRPHVTLGRVKDAKQAEPLTERLEAEREFSAGEFRVCGVSLFMSELRPSGPRYTRYGEFPFAAEL